MNYLRLSILAGIVLAIGGLFFYVNGLRHDVATLTLENKALTTANSGYVKQLSELSLERSALEALTVTALTTTQSIRKSTESKVQKILTAPTPATCLESINALRNIGSLE